MSFSIKPKDVEPSIINLRPALPQEPSSDEEDLSTKKPLSIGGVPSIPPPSLENSNYSATIKQSHQMPSSSTITAANRITVLENIELPALHLNGIALTNLPTKTTTGGIPTIITSTLPKLSSASIITTIKSSTDERTSMCNTKTNFDSTTSDLSEVILRDSMLEDNSNSTMTTMNNEKKQSDAKRAEEKFKDRMAQVARDKLGSITREKQLQLERKKRAMAFLNQIKSKNFQCKLRNVLVFNFIFFFCHLDGAPPPVQQNETFVKTISKPSLVEIMPKIDISTKSSPLPFDVPDNNKDVVDVVIASSESDNDSSVQSVHSSSPPNNDNLSKQIKSKSDASTILIRSKSRSR